MALTPEEKRVVEKLKKDPSFEFKPGLTDEEILAQARFIETGDGIDVYDSVEAWKAAQRKENTDEIEEV